MHHVRALALLTAAALVASCATTVPKIPTVAFDQYGLVQGPMQSEKRSDIEISVTTIRPADIYNYPNLFSFSLNESADYFLKQTYPAGPSGLSWEFPFMSPDGKVSLLLAWVKLTNGTEHILRMRDARVYLITEGYDPLPAFSAMEELYRAADGFEQEANQKLAGQWQKTMVKVGEMPQLPQGFYRRIINAHQGAYKLINDVGKEILPGFTYEGLLVFPTAPTVQGQARLAFYDITTKTDAAGNPLEKTRFEFPLENQHVTMWYDRAEKRWQAGMPPVSGGGSSTASAKAKSRK